MGKKAYQHFNFQMIHTWPKGLVSIALIS